MHHDNLAAFARLRGLLEVTKLVRSDAELDQLLAAVARAVSESLGFATVAVNLYRPAWDDFQTTTVHGDARARRTLIGDARGWEVWGRLIDDRFRRRGAYFVPHSEFDWNELAPDSYVPDLPRDRRGDAWHPEDALFVPLRHSDGHLLGVLGVDEPASGCIPSDDEVDVLVAVAEHAALALQSAQETAEAARHRAALEQLLQVSARLTETLSIDGILQSVCDGIRHALGFQNVCIDLADPDTGHMTARAAAGWALGDPAIEVAMSLGELEALMDEAFEVAGCYVLTEDEVVRRIGRDHSTYQSVMNGRGPKAWRNHWVFVPLHDRSGGVSGVIWVDDPGDRLLPSPATMQALRVFANQATTALDSAAQFEEMQFLAEHDPLTRLLNRRAFNQMLAAESSRSGRYGRQFALVLCDLDGFKRLNDERGHLAGDRALERLGRVLADGLREVDAAFRIGGDEFALLLPEAGRGEAQTAVERIVSAIADEDATGDQELSASFGLAVFPADGGDPEALFRAADADMYRAKQAQPGSRLPYAS
ncbi:MAG: diguanylate cyclase domain-containing protein [Gaiellales bacterium]